jgi:hypothetical protein
VEPAEILTRIRAQFGGEMLSGTQKCMTGVKSFQVGQMQFENVQTEPSAGKVMASTFWDSLGISFIDFLIQH